MLEVVVLECAVALQHYLETLVHMLKNPILLWHKDVIYVCMLEKAVEVVGYVTEVVLKQVMLVGREIADKAVVYVQKAVDLEQVSVVQALHVGAV